MRKTLWIVVLVLTLVSNLFLGFSVEASGKQFKDVPNNHQNKREIDYLVNLNVIKGYPDGRFKPMNAVTNGQAAMMIARALKVNLNNRPNPNFSDVFPTTSGFKEIAALVDEGIISQGKTFNPGLPISREAMARMLTRAFQLEGVHHVNFSDVPPHYWAYPYITKLAANNITTGYLDGTFKPKTTVTRAHFSAFMARALNSTYKPQPAVTRGINFNMNVKQVERMESAWLIKKDVEGTITKLTYDTTKFGYYAHLYYYFDRGQLLFIVYDFLPSKNSYDSYYEMEALHALLQREAVKEFGYDYFYNTNYYSKFTTNWYKNFYMTWLWVHDEQLYTTAEFVYSPSQNRASLASSGTDISDSLKSLEELKELFD